MPQRGDAPSQIVPQRRAFVERRVGRGMREWNGSLDFNAAANHASAPYPGHNHPQPLMNGYHNHAASERPTIQEVWSDNLHEEFDRIREVVERYQYIAMDTEFPGIVARPTGNFLNTNEYNYQTIKCNVDLLKVIQLGVTFADSHGNLPPGTSTWQFNFRFNLDKDMYAQDSIDFLKQSGINFEKHQAKGIEVYDFGELIMSSGLVMNEEVKWISFHGSYDFGYLLKLLTCASLPDSETQFFELLHDYFPALYDIKYLLRNAENLRINAGSSLQKIAEHLDVHRIGPQHQAGSDSLVTCRTFFKLMAVYFDNQIDDSKFSGIIYGLGQGYTPPIGSSHSLSNTPAPAGSAAARGVSSPALSGLPHQGPGGQQAPSSPGPVASEDGAGGLGRSHSYAASPGPLGLGAREFPGGSPGAERSPALSPQLDPGASTPNPRGAGGGAAPHAVTPQPGGGTGSVALSGVVNGPSGYPMLEMRRPASPDAQRPGAGSYDRASLVGGGMGGYGHAGPGAHHSLFSGLPHSQSAPGHALGMGMGLGMPGAHGHSGAVNGPVGVGVFFGGHGHGVPHGHGTPHAHTMAGAVHSASPGVGGSGVLPKSTSAGGYPSNAETLQGGAAGMPLSAFNAK